MLSNKSWGKKEEEALLGVMAFIFPSKCYTCWTPTFLKTAEHLSVDN